MTGRRTRESATERELREGIHGDLLLHTVHRPTCCCQLPVSGG